jgi:LPS export ABC transporter protein LptC
MINKIRKILLVLATSLILIAGYYLYLSLQKSGIKVKLHMTGEGMDVVIENFKVVHENDGKTDWELHAESAKVNNKSKFTYLKKVNVEMAASEDQKYLITADNGILQNDTNDFDLEGHVKFNANSDILTKKLQLPSTN